MTYTTEFPNYLSFTQDIACLNLPFSASQLHGTLCGYLSTASAVEGEAYLRALIPPQSEPSSRTATLALFNLYTTSQQQIEGLGFHFELLLPHQDERLAERAQAFSEWCAGYSESLELSGIDESDLHDEDAIDALHHLREFASLDYQSLELDSTDETALMEVHEYTRMAVLCIHSDLNQNKKTKEKAIH